MVNKYNAVVGVAIIFLVMTMFVLVNLQEKFKSGLVYTLMGIIVLAVYLSARK